MMHIYDMKDILPHAHWKLTLVSVNRAARFLWLPYINGKAIMPYNFLHTIWHVQDHHCYVVG
jgi:hypothetical protein